MALATVSAAGGFGVGRGLREGGAEASDAVRAVGTTSTLEVSTGREEPRHSVLALADGCDGLGGALAPGLTPRQVAMGSGPDPRTGDTKPYATVSMAGDMGSSGRVLDSAPFSVTLALQPRSVAPGRGSSIADRIGAVQLWAFWDGRALHKAVRTWRGSSWSIVADVDAGELTAVAGSQGMRFYWAGIDQGSRYGALVASRDGCAAEGLDAELRPALGG